MSFERLRNGATSHVRYEYLGKGTGMRTSWYHMKFTHKAAVQQSCSREKAAINT